MKIIFLGVFAAVLSAGSEATAQSFLNLDFEYGVYKSQPRKWAIEGEGIKYTAALDSNQFKSGHKSLYIQVTDGAAYTFLSLPGELIKGKSIQVQGYIRFKNGDSINAMFAFRNPACGKPDLSQAFKGANNQWLSFSHSATFPENYASDRLLVALVCTGTGSLWFDNVTIKIDGQPYGDDDPDFGEPSDHEIASLNKIVVPVSSFSRDGDDLDLLPLNKIIGNANIVALGENSHGSSTIYKFKLRMLRYLVRHLGFTMFALEAPVVEADRINGYVVENKGTLEDVINNLVYPGWQTGEMIDIIKWMKNYNTTAQNKIQFRGFDMQNGIPALEAIEQYAEKNDTTLLTYVAEIKKMISDVQAGKFSWSQLYERGLIIRQTLLHTNRPADSGHTVTEWKTIDHYLDIFLQSIALKYTSETAKSRDAYMALNIKWLMQNVSNEKIIVSADNTHITKASGKMGSFLKEWYGEKYIAVGFTYQRGTYAAYGPEKFYEVHPSYPGTYEYLFSKAKYKNFILDLRRTQNILRLPVVAGFRSIGSRPQETTQFTEIDLNKHFDLLIYLDSSIHTSPINR